MFNVTLPVFESAHLDPSTKKYIPKDILNRYKAVTDNFDNINIGIVSIKPMDPKLGKCTFSSNYLLFYFYDWIENVAAVAAHTPVLRINKFIQNQSYLKTRSWLNCGGSSASGEIGIAVSLGWYLLFASINTGARLEQTKPIHPEKVAYTSRQHVICEWRKTPGQTSKQDKETQEIIRGITHMILDTE